MRMTIYSGSRPSEIATEIAYALLRYGLIVLAASLLMLWASPTARADEVSAATLAKAAVGTDEAPRKPTREYLIKAAIVFNLAKFASWPASAFADDKAVMRICVFGDNPFGSALAALQGKQVGQHTLVTATLDNIEDAAACHVLFVSASEADHLPAVLQAVAGQPVLTVADMQKFTVHGGIVRLTEEDGRSGLEVNLIAADRAGIRLSSKLLRLAETVPPQTAYLNERPQK